MLHKICLNLNRMIAIYIFYFILYYINSRLQLQIANLNRCTSILHLANCSVVVVRICSLYDVYLLLRRGI